MLTIRPAVETDVPALAELLAEMDRYYGGPGHRDNEEEDVRAAALGEYPRADVLVVYEDERLIGFASCTFLWPAVGLTKSLFLKEIYVAQAARGTGVGTALMRRVFGVAREAGCRRVEWMTGSDNTDAQAFYAKLGAPVFTEKVHYRVEGDGLDEIAG